MSRKRYIPSHHKRNNLRELSNQRRTFQTIARSKEIEACNTQLNMFAASVPLPVADPLSSKRDIPSQYWCVLCIVLMHLTLFSCAMRVENKIQITKSA